MTNTNKTGWSNAVMLCDARIKGKDDIKIVGTRLFIETYQIFCLLIEGTLDSGTSKNMRAVFEIRLH